MNSLQEHGMVHGTRLVEALFELLWRGVACVSNVSGLGLVVRLAVRLLGER